MNMYWPMHLLFADEAAGDGACEVERVVVKLTAPIHAAFESFFFDIIALDLE